jgi:hypothetical protein
MLLENRPSSNGLHGASLTLCATWLALLTKTGRAFSEQWRRGALRGKLLDISLGINKMIKENDKRRGADELFLYQDVVSAVHPSNVESWPLLNGWDLLLGSFKDWQIAVFKDAAFTGTRMSHYQGVGELSEGTVGAIEITQENRDAVRTRLERHFNIGKRDAIVLYPPDRNIFSELQAMLWRHELALGLENFSKSQGVRQTIGSTIQEYTGFVGFYSLA